VIDGLPDNDPNKVSSLNFQGGGDLDKGVKPFKLMGDLLKTSLVILCIIFVNTEWAMSGNGEMMPMHNPGEQPMTSPIPGQVLKYCFGSG
jgi:hypothetical protein